VPALAVAVETNPAVGGLLEHALIAAGPGETVLRRIAADLPYPTIALAGTAAIVHTRLAVLASGDPSRRASHLTSLSNSLGDIGEREKALAAIEETVALYRELAAARPDAFRPELATSVNTWSVSLSELGQREESLAAAEETVALYRELAAARPDAFRPDLARSLRNQSAYLSHLGQRQESLAAAEEAVALYRELAAARPDAFRPALASSLHTLSLALSHFRRREEAVAVNRELVPQQATFARVQ